MKNYRNHRSSNEQSLKDVLTELVDGYGLRNGIEKMELLSLWDDVAGGMIAKHTTDLRLHGSRLRVRLDSAPLRHELCYMKDGLIKLINEKLGRELITEITLE